MSRIITDLKIDRLAGLGDGAGTHEGHRIFVPYTTAGDVIHARVTKQTADATFAAIETIVTPGPDRVTPPCKHFGVCGGCSLQHLSNSTYTAFKHKMAQEAVRKAGYDENCTDTLVTIPANSRRRVDLKISDGKLGFYAAASHRIVDIEECKVLEPELFELIMQLKQHLLKYAGITGIQINGIDDGYDVLLEGRLTSAPSFAELKTVKRLSIQENNKIRILHQMAPVTVTLGEYAVEVPPGAFLQASREAQTIMTALVLAGIKESKNILDLFAGVGTYSFPASKLAKVTAIEGEKSMADAMNKTATKFGLTANFKASHRDLFLTPLKGKELAGYDAVIINPPRAGAKAQCTELAQAKVAKIVMVSCNPATFTRDARILKESGYQLKKVIPIDQFTYSSHLELVAEFSAN